MIGTVPRSKLPQLCFAVHEVGLQFLNERILASGIDAKRRRAVRHTGTVASGQSLMRQLRLIVTQLGLQIGAQSSQLLVEPCCRLSRRLDPQFEYRVYVSFAKCVSNRGREFRIRGREADADQAALGG